MVRSWWGQFTWVMMLVADGFWIGAYDDEEAAARAYDLAALKYWGPGTLINFPVTDYTRDLEEMQNVSREEYLASLRRKSSGFSRGLSKYRGLSSYICGASSSLLCYTATDFMICRWESSYGRISGSDYFNSMHYGAGDDSAAESEYVSGFCIERKIDLTSHIKWWGSNKTRHSDSGTRLSSEEKKLGSAGDICSELKQLEQKVQPTEPYQMPQLGRPHNEKKQRSSSVSALRILSQSAAYKSLQEKASKRQENSIDNDENENKNTVNKLDHGKAVEKPSNHDGGSDRLDIAMGMSGTMPLQRNIYPLTPFLSAPLLTAYNTVDPMVDPVLWTSLVPVLPAGLSRTDEVTKTETSSTYTMFQPEE
ncbi:AP2-like ethylene-responsive transcription factor At2g41710 isoform X5 [Vigna angularis]|uniref:AP2-like ethylene-responsive transcription factor At2g41710 isoform X5 n=1 Tax=Phaseolus angularis TaxID=3914 RepID=UPI0022B55CF6|nr:AP2-like ethylene-responsive transcription factor At2g41710 isoform X5 [Vigna angularis]